MITKETTISQTPFTFRFRVVDDKNWIVTISNNEEEWGCSSDFCTGNWNKGLVDAVRRAFELKPTSAKTLMDAIIANSFIDHENFIEEWRKHLHEETTVSYDEDAVDDYWANGRDEEYYRYDDDDAYEAALEKFNLICLDIEDKLNKIRRRYEFKLPEKYNRY